MSDAPPHPEPEPGAPSRLAAERDRELALVEQVAADLADAERALTRLDEGTYGTCEACGATLEDTQLVLEPAARWCPQHRPPAAG